MNSVAFVSPFIPPEWIAAHGLRPERRVPLATGEIAAEGRCPFADAVARGAPQDDEAEGWVLTTTCDQMRRTDDVFPAGARRFLFHVPATWQSPAAHRHYRQELDRLGRWLVAHGGTTPDKTGILGAVAAWEDGRERLLAARRVLHAAEWARVRNAFHRTGQVAFATTAVTTRPSGRPWLLLGGPLLDDEGCFLGLVERVGGRIIADGTEQGERTWPRRCDRRRLRCEPLDEVADAYFGSIPDIFRRPNTALFEWLSRTIRNHGIRGVVLIVHRWCDLWRAEIPRLREVAGVPLLPIDPSTAYAPLENRLRAFAEVTA